MVNAGAVFIGDGSLLIQCVDAFLNAGHTVKAVASHSPSIVAWSKAKSLVTVEVHADDEITIPAAEFDYLFSIANLSVLPAGLIARAQKLAINFHDALLPRYAGLNATSWALFAREAVHGVTWHEMTAAVDAGRIVKQASFQIAETETALSLNARCYEAGLATFKAMLEDLGRDGELALAEQAGSGSYFGRHQRPDALATLDFSKSAMELAALVRGLDFGSYPNPLARPKFIAGDKLLWVRTAHVMPSTSSAARPGTVLGAEGDALLVATGDGDLSLGGFSDAMGQACPHGIAAGTVLPMLNSVQREKLAAHIPQAAAGEVFWRNAFAALAPVAIPYPQKSSQQKKGTRQTVHLRLDVAGAGGARTVAAFFAWLSALTGQEKISVVYSDAVLGRQAEGLVSWLSPWVPLTVLTAPQTSVPQAIANAEIQIDRCRKAGSYPRDLPSRLGDSGFSVQRFGRVGICLGGAPGPGDLDLLLALDPSGQNLELAADGSVFSNQTIHAMADHLASYLKAFATASGSVVEVPLISQSEAEVLAAMNATTTPFDDAQSVHGAIAAQVARTAQHTALCHQDQSLSYSELDRRATTVAGRLIACGVMPGDIVGLCLERSPDLVIGLLAILKAGAAYLPLDPDYPHDRIALMIEDSKTALVISNAATASALDLPSGKTFLIDRPEPLVPSGETVFPTVGPDDAAYVIYTSGSTGRPKGVVVTHRNVMNFFAGMAQRVPHDPPRRWLAVTSLSFDISVLELCWTLTRGFTVVLHSKSAVPKQSNAPDFSLYYFGNDTSAVPADRYKLLMEGAKFADAQGFSAIWTPERHFHAFGGLYPNPAVTSAAVAAITTRIKIRAGSCVLPLHHPIRVAEDWAFVDNISQGRVGISFAAGWQPNDFAIAPAAFANRKTEMLANIEVVRRLWRGESVAFPGPMGKDVDIQTLPRPVQNELPVWLTAAGNPETFQQAGALGCHLLTHLLGQSMEDVAKKLQLYRTAWREAGHAGAGHVTMMLHTFVGPDEEQVRDTVRGPMKEYLRSSVDLIKQAAWSFPTFVQRGEAHGKSPVEIMDSEELSAKDMDALLDHAFSRYYGTSALFGTPQRCLAMVDTLKRAGVDEIACLIDFGVDIDTVLAHLQDLKQLMDASRHVGPADTAPQHASVAGEITGRAITHLQCTPSMASMLVADAAGRAALSRLSALMVGGEALPLKLAAELRALVPGALLNMYGPTETTVWSTTCDLGPIGDFVPLGQPIANTWLGIRSAWGLECPALVPGELLIGGAGVTRGYLNREELTAERFIDDPARPGSRLYRTGDLVRRHPDGALEFLGRIDQQVKIRGHRIELGEIESALARQAGVKEAVAIAREDAGGDKAIVAYVTAVAGVTPDTGELQRALARELPEIMVPRAVHLLAAFPLTPNGKVDRRAVAEAPSVPIVHPLVAAESQHEKTVAAIWEQALGVAKVGMTDNFFDIGGHSLLVVQVQRRLREATGHEISITDMFRLTTVQALATYLSGNAAPTAVSDGLSRAQARRVVMRSRPNNQATPAG